MSIAKRDRDRSVLERSERRSKQKSNDKIKRMRTHDTGLDNSLNETYSKKNTRSKAKLNQAEAKKDPFADFYQEDSKKAQNVKDSTKLDLHDL